MATLFYPLTVKEVRRETPDCVSVAFDVPATCAALFTFCQGQYLTVRAQLQGTEQRRAYSICSGTLDGELRIAVKKVPGGAFSTYINESLRPGDLLEAMPPAGRFFTSLDAAQCKTYVAFAAGSGITPVISILRTVLAVEPESRFVLVYGNQYKGSIIFKSQLEQLKNRYMHRLSIHHILSREEAGAAVLCGRIDKAKALFFLQHLLSPAAISECFICGPQGMVQQVKEALLESGVAAAQIHVELFYAAGNQAKQPVAIAAAEDHLSEVTIQRDGAVVQVQVPYHAESILEAALRSGADLPYACKGGVCATCKARLENGQVAMTLNYALEPDEQAAGFILTCQSHPRSPTVHINFDHT